MKFQSKNMHYVFHREYFEGLELLSKDAQDVEERNQAVFSFAFPKENPFDKLRDMPNFHAFQLVTTYPGLLIGTGNPHDAKLDAAIKLGFSFDYVTGLPCLPGSSLKGLLRSRFPGKYTGEDKADREILLGAYLQRDDINAAALETEIFNGGDIFLGAFPVDWPNDGMLSMEYITPHKEFQDPVPISLLKIKPNVCFEFGFLLSDGEQINAAQKCGLFQELVMEAGVGAKTNVGFGRMVKPEARPQKNRIGYDPVRYAEMNRILQAHRPAPRPSRPQTSQNRPKQQTAAQASRQTATPKPDSRPAQSGALGKCPKCGADIVPGDRFPRCAGNCGFRPGRPNGYQNFVTEDEYRRLFHGETILMRGFKSAKYGDFDALVSLKGYQEPKPDARTGKPVYWGAYEVERQF